MQLDLQCKKCEESFSVELAEVSTEPAIRCPGCGARGPEEQVEIIVGALEELFAALAPMRRKFSIAVELDSEAMPPPYDEVPTVSKKATLIDEEASEDEDDEEEEEVAEQDLE